MKDKKRLFTRRFKKFLDNYAWPQFDEIYGKYGDAKSELGETGRNLGIILTMTKQDWGTRNYFSGGEEQ